MVYFNMEKASGQYPNQDRLSQAARLLKVLGHPARLQIMYYVEGGEKTVTAIQRFIGHSQAMTSQHLKLLYDADLLIRRREGTRIYYRLSDNLGRWMLEFLGDCMPLWEQSLEIRSKSGHN